MSSKSVHKKLIRAREVCMGAGFLLEKLQVRYGDDFGEGMHIQVQQAINECRQQGLALSAVLASNAVEAERIHQKNKGAAIAKATGGAA